MTKNSKYATRKSAFSTAAVRWISVDQLFSRVKPLFLHIVEKFEFKIRETSQQLFVVVLELKCTYQFITWQYNNPHTDINVSEQTNF